jgi:N-hydroxyarylamine O-acetyltransferase
MAGVLRAHMTHVPFENLDVLLGRDIHLDENSVYTKLVAARRGGYCFEHGTLFQVALRHLGFSPVAHAARVLLVRPRNEAPLTHMFLTVQFDDARYVLDPGFGGHGPLVPVPLTSTEARDQRDVHRMIRCGDDWVLEAQVDGTPTPLWCSTLEAAEPVDFVMANHFVATFPTSIFVTNLMLRAIRDDERVSVMNRAVTRSHDGGERKHELESRAALRKLLNEDFGFDLPGIESLRVPSVPEWT